MITCDLMYVDRSKMGLFTTQYISLDSINSIVAILSIGIYKIFVISRLKVKS